MPKRKPIGFSQAKRFIQLMKDKLEKEKDRLEISKTTRKALQGKQAFKEFMGSGFYNASVRRLKKNEDEAKREVKILKSSLKKAKKNLRKVE